MSFYLTIGVILLLHTIRLVTINSMFWFCALLIILAANGSYGKCTINGPTNSDAECISIDEEQLMSFLKDNIGNLRTLTIENSFIPHIEIFPIQPDDVIDVHIQSLTIKNSRIKSILENGRGVGGVQYSKELNLSFNDIEEIGFLRHMNNLERAVIHHNKIQFINFSDLPNSEYEEEYDRSLWFLDLSHNNIKNLTILKRYGLRNLNLSHNSLEEIGSALTKLWLLQIADLSYNKLRNFSFENFHNLIHIEYLNLSHNQIYSIGYNTPQVGGSYHFQSIYGGNGKAVIDLSFNKVEKINHIIHPSTGYYFQSKLIILENNDLKNLSFLLNRTSIVTDSLTFRNNKIKNLLPHNFENCNLLKLDLSFNEIESLVPSAFGGLETKELSLAHNKIKFLNISIFSNAMISIGLNLSHNPLTSIDGMFSMIPSYSYPTDEMFSMRPYTIDLSHCLLKEIPLGVTGPSLSEIYLNNNNIDSIESNTFSSLDILDLSYNKLRNLQVNVFSGIIINSYLNLANNNLSALEGVFANTKIKNVTLTGISLNKLSEKDLIGLNMTEYLDLSNTGVMELSNNTFDRLKQLKNISLNDNSIHILPSNFFGFNENLISLSILRNPLSIISLDSFPHKMKLRYLFLTINGRILKKRFFNMIFLEELHFIDSVITEVHKYSFKGLVSLKKLKFENSTVSKIEPGAFLGLRDVLDLDAQILFANISHLKSKLFVGLLKLETLDLSGIGINIIEDDAFFGLESLANLNLSNNKIGNLPKNAFLGLKSLKMLDLSHNNLTGKESTFPIGIFRDLVNLTHLHLQHNRIIKFHIGEFSNLRNLRFLNISHNQLSYLDRHLLFPLKNLEVLDINSNQVIKFDYHFTLKHLSSLKTIGIGENKWPCENMTIMLNNFEVHGVNYRDISKLAFEVENIGGIYCVHICNYLYCPTEEDLVVTY